MSRCSLIVLVGILCAVYAHAQASPNDAALDDIAQRVTARASKAHVHRVLVLTIQGCLLDPTICSSVDQKIRAELRMVVPDVQLLARADVLPLLPTHGLLPVDAYTAAVEPVAVDLGADLMITESLTSVEGGYYVSATLWDLAKRTNLDEFRTRLTYPDSELDSTAGPLFFREPPEGPALLIPRRVNGPSKGRFPSCDYCPEPAYTDQARAEKIQGIVLLTVTITEQGTAKQVAVIRGLGAGLSDSAVRAVLGWHFKPALDTDGKPLATRTPIEVNFRLLLKR